MGLAVIVGGVRTPFIKADGQARHLTAHDLGHSVVSNLLCRYNIKPTAVDQVIIGNVGSPPEAANVARVIAVTAGLPYSCPAHTVHRNCISGMQAVVDAALAIEYGQSRVVIAGGTESMSNIPLVYSRGAVEAFRRLVRAKGWRQKFNAILQFRPRHFIPIPALRYGLTDKISGMIMGETAEVLAAEFGISRNEQDGYAVASHQAAAAAIQSGRLATETIPIQAKDGRKSTILIADDNVRTDKSLQSLPRLLATKFKPYFDAEHGTVTIANSCSITDGAAALIIMDYDYALANGYCPLASIVGHSIVGLDPVRMGLGPAYAIAKLAATNRFNNGDVDLWEINEAFAAQMLATLRLLASDGLSDRYLGRPAFGEIPRERLNVNGGAIAIGHPIGASGARLILTLALEMKLRSKRRGIAAMCASGGQGMAVALESPAA